MTDPVTCPHCREHLDIPADYRGRAVRCASCQNVFTVPPAAPAADEPPPELTRDTPRPPRRRPRDEDDRPRRQGNGGVWALLFVTLLVVGGCAFGCAGVFVWMHNPTMHPFESAEGKFRIEFPGDPHPRVTTGERGRVTVTAHRQQSQEQYAVKCYDVPLTLRFLSPEDALEKLGATELKEYGTEVRREAIRFGDRLPALDLMATAGAGLMNKRVTVLRLVLVGNRVYVVSAQGPNLDQQPLWWVRRYFNSFELTGPAAQANAAEKAGDGPNPFNNKGEKKADDGEK